MAEQERVTLETFDIMRLLSLLPHRYPLPAVDRIVEVDSTTIPPSASRTSRSTNRISRGISRPSR
jgi:hypothetical protein